MSSVVSHVQLSYRWVFCLQVYVDALGDDDLEMIVASLHPNIPPVMRRSMINFNAAVHRETMVKCSFGRKGAPWDFNLRDVFRWCELMESNQLQTDYRPDEFVHIVYTLVRVRSLICCSFIFVLFVRCCFVGQSLCEFGFLISLFSQRFRTEEDRKALARLFHDEFGYALRSETHPSWGITDSSVRVGSVMLPKNTRNWLGTGADASALLLLQNQLRPLEAMMHSVSKQWMTLLTGPADSGKSSLVRLLAQLSNNPLRELSMNSAIDTMEILGM